MTAAGLEYAVGISSERPEGRGQETHTFDQVNRQSDMLEHFFFRYQGNPTNNTTVDAKSSCEKISKL